MVSHRHELGQGRISKDGIVGQVNVGDVEVNELGVVVVASAEGHGKADLPQGLVEPPPTPEKGLLGLSRSSGT